MSTNGNLVAFSDLSHDKQSSETDLGGVSGNTHANAGRVRVFKYENGAWSQRGSSLIGENANDSLGFSVQMSEDGKYLIFSSQAVSKVYIFEWNGTAYVQRGSTLTGVAGDQFGESVDISKDGSMVAVGYRGADVAEGALAGDSGLVKMYKWNGTNAYTLINTFTHIDALAGAGFGSVVRLSSDGTRLIVGADSDDAGGSSSGIVYTFEYDGSSWLRREPYGSIGTTAPANYLIGRLNSTYVSRDGSTIGIGEYGSSTGGTSSGSFRVFHMPSNIKSIWGSNDDVNWTKITTGNETFRGDDRLEFKNLDNPNYYKYHAIVADAFTRLKDVKLFGIRNQGSSTLHDGALTLTKKVTAPQLESTGIINMKGDYTEIRANSNVVTCFDRSKKLIKYPRVAMTDNSSGGYVASASSTYTNFNPYEAFDNEDPGSTAYWSGSTQIYNTNGTWGGGTAAAYTTNVEGVSKYGEWIQIQLPNKIKYNYSKIKAPSPAARQPRDGYILGSNDTSGAWTILHRFEDVSRSSTADLVTYTPPSEYTQFFQYFRLVIETINDGGLQYVGVNTWDIFGCPEYDPEAHGTDVTIKSYPNVPNTDWLEVYYDGQDYTQMPATVTDKSGNDRDAEMNATFDNGEIKAFNFTGSHTSNVTTSDHGLGTGDVTYTVSYWFKRIRKRNNYDYLYIMGNGGSTGQASLMWILNEQLSLDHWSTQTRYNEPIQNNRWYHVAAGHRGGVAVTNDFLFIDGQNVGVSVSTPQTFDLQGSKLTLGTSHNSVNEFLEGSIANFRLFNRALTSDEIYQLYAYQKEYFGHGDLGMTLKAGRLGIGTSEPRAMLDVRGDAFFNGLISSGMPAIFGAVNNANYVQQSAISQNISVVQFSQGPNMERAAGGITCPIAGMYQVQLYTHCWFSGGAYAVKSTQTLDRYNSAGTIYSKANRGSIHNVTMGSSGGNSDQHQITTWLIQVNAGDYLILNHLTSPSTTRNYSNEWNYISAVCVCANNQSLGGGGGSGGGY
jgi:hypothetical protein